MIQCQPEDKIGIIIEKFLTKIQKKKSSIFFIYSGNKLDEELTFNKAANNLDKANNIMKVLVFDNLSEEEKASTFKRAKNIICPQCNEIAHISINDFKITVKDCINEHVTPDIKFKEFEKTQYIDESKIVCDNCQKRNKNESYGNNFFKCFSCKMNLCPICKDSHDKSHHIFDYDDKDFFCKNHNEAFIYFCKNCKKDICALCENQHSEHEKITYGSIMPDIEKNKKDMKYLKIRIKDLKKNIKYIISNLNKLNEILDDYFILYCSIIDNFDIKKRNFLTLTNINNIKDFNIDFMKTITEISNDTNIKTQFNELIKMLSSMTYKYSTMFGKNKMKEIEEMEEKNKKENKEVNNENNEDKNEGNNYYNNIQRYNPFNDKYENFNISKTKELKSFSVKYEIKNIIVLHDKRLLYYGEDIGKDIYKITVYDLNDDIVCDINYDVNFNIIDIFQMNDDNITAFFPDGYTVFKIKTNSLELIDRSLLGIKHAYKLLNNKFLIDLHEEFKIFLYSNGKMTRTQDNFEKKNNLEIIDICGINENEIVMYYFKEVKIFGNNAFLLLYNIKDFKDIKKIKLGNYQSGTKLLLVKDNNLLLGLNEKLVIIDINNRAIKKEYNIYRSIRQIIDLNEKVFLVAANNDIYQYEIIINTKSIELKDEKIVFNNLIGKYPDNKLVFGNNERYEHSSIYIYG